MCNYTNQKMGRWDEKSFLKWRTSLARQEMRLNQLEEDLSNRKIRIEKKELKLKSLECKILTCINCQCKHQYLNRYG